MKRYKCRCCGYYTLEEPPGSYDICPICFWEDDPYQNEDSLFDGGANKVNLEEAQLNYQVFGASDREVLEYCRRPTDKDMIEKDDE